MDTIVSEDEAMHFTEKVRRLMRYGQVMQSHVLQLFHFASPNLLFAFQVHAARRNIFEPLKEQPELGRREVTMRKFGQHIVDAIGQWRK